jgi:histidine triad (HIT) family protein
MASIFTKIIRSEIPCYKVAENELCFAFLDISPLKYGHVLVVSKKETDYLFDLPETDYNALFAFAKKVAKAIKTVTQCKRVSLHVIGLEVPHAHIHLIPINSMNDCNFSNQKLQASQEEFVEIAHKISTAFHSV